MSKEQRTIMIDLGPKDSVEMTELEPSPGGGAALSFLRDDGAFIVVNFPDESDWGFDQEGDDWILEVADLEFAKDGHVVSMATVTIQLSAPGMVSKTETESV